MKIQLATTEMMVRTTLTLAITTMKSKPSDRAVMTELLEDTVLTSRTIFLEALETTQFG